MRPSSKGSLDLTGGLQRLQPLHSSRLMRFGSSGSIKQRLIVLPTACCHRPSRADTSPQAFSGSVKCGAFCTAAANLSRLT